MIVAFTESETADILEQVNAEFWSKRRPPVHLRDKICEGQRLEGQSLELFFRRPVWDDPTRHVEEEIAKLTYVRSRDVWRIFWKRADGKWHGYSEHPEAPSLIEALKVVAEDHFGCFFG